MKPSDDNQPKQTINADRGSTIQNVVQAAIHMPAWAWILSMTIITVGLCIAVISATAIFNQESLRKLLPTPPAFPTATADQSLIIVADFDDQSNGKYTGITPSQYIYDRLYDQIEKDNLNIRVEHLHEVVNDNNAKSIGETYNATMVVWGWYDALTITPRIQRIRLLNGDPSDQAGLQFTLADPDKVKFSIVTDLPTQVNYLIMFTLGADKFSNNQFDDALPYFDQAIQVAISNTKTTTNPSEAYFFRGDTYYHKGNYDLAIPNYSKAIDLNPNYPQAYNNRGSAYIYKGEYDLAIVDLRKAIELDQTIIEIFNNLGVAYSRTGNYDLAITYLNKATAIDPGYFHTYNNRGIAYGKIGNYDLALSDFNKAIEINPNFALAYCNRGVMYYTQGDYNLAIADFNKTIELDPNYADAYYNRGLAYGLQGKNDLAIADYSKAIDLNPNLVKVYNSRAAAYINQGNYDLAIADANKSIALDKNSSVAYNNRGLAYRRQGNYDLAIADYSKAIELDPNYFEAYYNRGAAYYNQGKYYDLAIADFNKAIELNPNDANTYLGRGFSFEMSGEQDSAIKDFKHILEISADANIRKLAEDELKKLQGQ